MRMAFGKVICPLLVIVAVATVPTFRTYDESNVLHQVRRRRWNFCSRAAQSANLIGSKNVAFGAFSC
jgi:hypothetical protein